MINTQTIFRFLGRWPQDKNAKALAMFQFCFRFQLQSQLSQHTHWHSMRSRIRGKYFTLEPRPSCDSKQAGGSSQQGKGPKPKWPGLRPHLDCHSATIHQAARQQMSSGGRSPLTLTYRLARRHGLPIVIASENLLLGPTPSLSLSLSGANSNWVMTATMAKTKAQRRCDQNFLEIN